MEEHGMLGVSGAPLCHGAEGLCLDTPQPVEGLSNVLEIASGVGNIARLANGTAVTWGREVGGDLGTGPITEPK